MLTKRRSLNQHLKKSQTNPLLLIYKLCLSIFHLPVIGGSHLITHLRLKTLSRAQRWLCWWIQGPGQFPFHSHRLLPRFTNKLDTTISSWGWEWRYWTRSWGLWKCRIDSTRCFHSCKLPCHGARAVGGGAWYWVGGKPRHIWSDYQRLTSNGFQIILQGDPSLSRSHASGKMTLNALKNNEEGFLVTPLFCFDGDNIISPITTKICNNLMIFSRTRQWLAVLCWLPSTQQDNSPRQIFNSCYWRTFG